MMKKISAVVMICIFSQLSAHANSTWLEVKPGYFFFSNHTLRKIYHGGFEIQGSGTFSWCGPLALYTSLGYIRAHGRSLVGQEKTSVSQIPVDVGVRVIAEVSECLNGYLTIGPRFFYFHQHNDSLNVNRNIRATGFGFFVNGGFNIVHHEYFLVGIFGEYAFQQKSFSSTIPNVYGRQDVQLGGLTFGVSLGFAF